MQTKATARANEIARQKRDRDRSLAEMAAARERSLQDSLSRVSLRNQPAIKKTLQAQYTKWQTPRRTPPPDGDEADDYAPDAEV